MKTLCLLIVVVTLLLVQIPAMSQESPPPFLFEFGSINNPWDVDLDYNSNAFVTSVGNNTISKFDVDGNYILSFGSEGAGDGQFYSPTGIAVAPNGDVYVCDLNHCRIQQFDNNGNYIRQFGTCGTGNGQFNINDLYAIAVDQSGNVYQAGYRLGRVQVFSSDGTHLSTWGVGQIASPLGIAIDNSGNILISEQGGTVKRFTSSGSLLSSFATGLSYQYYLDVDYQDNVYVAGMLSSQVAKFSSNGSQLSVWSCSMPKGIAVGNSGLIYVVTNNRVQVYGDPAVPTEQKSWGDVKTLYR